MNPQMLNMKPIVSLLAPHYDILLTQLYYWWRLEWVSPHNYEIIPNVMAIRLDIMSKFRLSWAFLVLREGMKLYFASEGMKNIFDQQIDRFRHGPDAKMVIMGGTYDAKYFKLWVYIPYILMRLVIQDAIFTQNMQFMSPKSVTRVLIWGSSLEFIINKVLKVHRLRLNLRPNDRIKAITPVFTCRYEIKLPKKLF